MPVFSHCAKKLKVDKQLKDHGEEHPKLGAITLEQTIHLQKDNRNKIAGTN